MKPSLGGMLASLAVTPALQALLRGIGYLDLKPLDTWHLMGEAAVTYIVAAAAAAIACLWVVKTMKARIALLLAGLIVVFVSCNVYSSVAATPWPVAYAGWIDIGVRALFLLAYASYGFTVARVINILF